MYIFNTTRRMTNTTRKLIPIISEVILRYSDNPNRWICSNDKLEDIICNKEDLPKLIDDINGEIDKTIYRDLSFSLFKGITYGDLINNIQNYSQKYLQNGKS